MAAKNYRARVVRKELLSADLIAVGLELLEPKAISFLPGQFMNVLVADNIRRSYSLANTPKENTVLETIIDTTPGGVGSKFFTQVIVGTEMSILAPLGEFIYREGANPCHFFATGTGIVPFLSMIKHELFDVGSGRKMVLHHGARTEPKLIAYAQLRALAKRYENFTYNPFLSQPGARWAGRVGRICQDLPEVKAGEDVYLCGCAETVEQLRQGLLELGCPENKIFYESF
jgi:ferredoxin-NADP reductase